MKTFYLVAMLLFFGWYAVKLTAADAKAIHEASATEVAARITAFSGYVRAYQLDGNVLTEGTTPGGSIPVPSWFDGASHFSVVTEAGSTYVFMAMPDAAHAARVLTQIQYKSASWDKFLAGRNAGGELVTIRPAYDGVVMVPGSIPDNAVVVGI
ncbi:MAG: hypothetical protein A2580_08625 [Hydrogenophilales bacterium RIFOXYD1_FULL_62_11]|nr:MAG: hypothetical protein A2580_08625 [Hydrogenophilales bacterium RIFOXYD1_FULL_62_11]